MRKEILTSILAGAILGCAHAPKDLTPEWIHQEAYQTDNKIFMFATGKSSSQDAVMADREAIRNAIANAADKMEKMRPSYSNNAPIRPSCTPWKHWRDGWNSYAQVRCDYFENIK